VAVLKSLDRFATLATRLDSLNVTRTSLESHVSHVCHAEKKLDSANIMKCTSFVGSHAIFQWLSIVMEEGHLEPSQPVSGRAVGWPERWMTIRSFWIEFCCWCRYQPIPKEETPEQWAFYGLLDCLFVRHEEKYELPSLENCRKTFRILRQLYECD
jgi:hypothetical protein